MNTTIQGIEGERIAKQGKEGEDIARLFFKKGLNVDNIFHADWIVFKENIHYLVEVKYKELYTPKPFYGQGLDIREIKARMKLYEDTGIRCLFLPISKPDNIIYWQWLDVLEKTKYLDTKNKIRVYNIENFKRIPDNIYKVGA